MRDKEYYDTEVSWELPAFGITAFNIPEAAGFVAKILCLEGYLDKEVPDEQDEYSLDNPRLDTLLKKEIEEFRVAILSGIEKETLKPLYVSRNIKDQIDETRTYIDIQILNEWLEKRDVFISGDFYTYYLDKVCDVYNAAIEAIINKEEKIRLGIEDSFDSKEKEKIFLLERKIQELENNLNDQKKDKEEKPLGTTERNSLYKMILGMAISGYGYDPEAKKNDAIKDISDDMVRNNISLTAETIRSYLKKANSEFPVSIEKSDS